MAPMPSSTSSRSTPSGPVTRWMQGQLVAVRQFSGTGSGSLQVRPPSVLFCNRQAGPPWPSGKVQNMVRPSAISSVSGWPKYRPGSLATTTWRPLSADRSRVGTVISVGMVRSQPSGSLRPSSRSSWIHSDSRSSAA